MRNNNEIILGDYWGRFDNWDFEKADGSGKIKGSIDEQITIEALRAGFGHYGYDNYPCPNKRN